MVHFLFYVGKATWYKKHGSGNPIGKAVQDGYAQEFSDNFTAPWSTYSYEDLPSDKLGAIFAINYFDEDSDLTLGEQLKIFFNKYSEIEPSVAPNHKKLSIVS